MTHERLWSARRPACDNPVTRSASEPAIACRPADGDMHARTLRRAEPPRRASTRTARASGIDRVPRGARARRRAERASPRTRSRSPGSWLPPTPSRPAAARDRARAARRLLRTLRGGADAAAGTGTRLPGVRRAGAQDPARARTSTRRDGGAPMTNMRADRDSRQHHAEERRLSPRALARAFRRQRDARRQPALEPRLGEDDAARGDAAPARAAGTASARSSAIRRPRTTPQRLARSGAPVRQITTAAECRLDAT